jgi:hypothetical protein
MEIVTSDFYAEQSLTWLKLMPLLPRLIIVTDTWSMSYTEGFLKQLGYEMDGLVDGVSSELRGSNISH